MKWYRVCDSTHYDINEDGIIKNYTSLQWVSECGYYLRRLSVDRNGERTLYAKLYLKFKTRSRWYDSLEMAIEAIEWTPHKLKKAMYDNLFHTVNVEIPLGLLSPEVE